MDGEPTEATAIGRLENSVPGKPGSVQQAHTEMQAALGESHMLIEELLAKLQPVLNTSVELTENAKTRQANYITPVASWIWEQTSRVHELNDKIRATIKLVDI